MSSTICMPSFSEDPAAEGIVLRVLRRQGFVVDIGEPLIEVLVGPFETLTVGTHRDGGIYEMRASVGHPIRAGDTIAVVGEGDQNFKNAVFIAYRRADSSGYTGRIYDGVVRDLGKHQVFRDLGSLRPGRDFVEQVASALRLMRLMVVVIAPSWLNAVNHQGEPRLADPQDLHRVEIRTALERGKPIVRYWLAER